MGGFGSIWHWVIVGVIVVVLFGGRGKISDLMGDFAKGIKAFKKGMSDEDEKPAQAPPVASNEPVRTLPLQPGDPAAPVSQPRPAAADHKAV